MNDLDAAAAILGGFSDARIIILITYNRDVHNALKVGARATF